MNYPVPDGVDFVHAGDNAVLRVQERVESKLHRHLMIRQLLFNDYTFSIKGCVLEQRTFRTLYVRRCLSL